MKLRFFCLVELPGIVTIEIEMDGGGILSADLAPNILKTFLLASNSFFVNEGEPVNGWQEMALRKPEPIRF